jgi:hypothetical protein
MRRASNLQRSLVLLVLPLLACIVPDVVIGYGFVIPGSCIAGLNEYTIGYAACIIGFIPTYISGVYIAMRIGREGGIPAVT